MVYNRAMKHNEKNLIVENVLSEEEISSLYSRIENPTQKFVMKLFVQSVSDFELPKAIHDKVISYCERISEESDLEISEYQFARYKNVFDEESGKMLFPNLTPHWDSSFEEPRFTFDYQIGGNTSWPLVVEGKKFTLKNNSALTFSGTHQIHWREKKTFSDDEYIDIIFFHLRKKGSQRSSQELLDKMEKAEQDYLLEYEKDAV
jgi:hypothetical protein